MMKFSFLLFFHLVFSVLFAKISYGSAEVYQFNTAQFVPKLFSPPNYPEAPSVLSLEESLYPDLPHNNFLFNQNLEDVRDLDKINREIEKINMSSMKIKRYFQNGKKYYYFNESWDDQFKQEVLKELSKNEFDIYFDKVTEYISKKIKKRKLGFKKGIKMMEWDPELRIWSLGQEKRKCYVQYVKCVKYEKKKNDHIYNKLLNKQNILIKQNKVISLINKIIADEKVDFLKVKDALKDVKNFELTNENGDTILSSILKLNNIPNKIYPLILDILKNNHFMGDNTHYFRELKTTVLHILAQKGHVKLYKHLNSNGLLLDPFLFEVLDNNEKTPFMLLIEYKNPKMFTVCKSKEYLKILNNTNYYKILPLILNNYLEDKNDIWLDLFDEVLKRRKLLFVKNIISDIKLNIVNHVNQVNPFELSDEEKSLPFYLMKHLGIDGRERAMKMINDFNINIDTLSKKIDGTTLLHIVIRKGDLKFFMFLKKMGIIDKVKRLSIKNNDNLTPINTALNFNEDEMALELLKTGTIRIAKSSLGKLVDIVHRSGDSKLMDRIITLSDAKLTENQIAEWMLAGDERITQCLIDEDFDLSFRNINDESFFYLVLKKYSISKKNEYLNISKKLYNSGNVSKKDIEDILLLDESEKEIVEYLFELDIIEQDKLGTIVCDLFKIKNLEKIKKLVFNIRDYVKVILETDFLNELTINKNVSQKRRIEITNEMESIINYLLNTEKISFSETLSLVILDHASANKRYRLMENILIYNIFDIKTLNRNSIMKMKEIFQQKIRTNDLEAVSILARKIKNIITPKEEIQFINKAIVDGKYDLLEILLFHSFDPNILDHENRNALITAIRCNNVRGDNIFELLTKFGAKL